MAQVDAHTIPTKMAQTFDLSVALEPWRAIMERRQFGRRIKNVHGWIRVAGRPKIPCTVRNVSPKGALLELDPPSWLPFRFELQLEPDLDIIHCEIRHVLQHAIGVMFCSDVQTGAVSLPSVLQDKDLWMGEGARPLVRQQRK